MLENSSITMMKKLQHNQILHLEKLQKQLDARATQVANVQWRNQLLKHQKARTINNEYTRLRNEIDSGSFLKSTVKRGEDRLMHLRSLKDKLAG